MPRVRPSRPSASRKIWRGGWDVPTSWATATCGVAIRTPPSGARRPSRRKVSVLEGASAVIAVSPGVADSLRSRFPVDQKIHVITNGYDPGEFEQVEASPVRPLRDRLRGGLLSSEAGRRPCDRRDSTLESGHGPAGRGAGLFTTTGSTANTFPTRRVVPEFRTRSSSTAASRARRRSRRSRGPASPSSSLRYWMRRASRSAES